jgi:type II secretory pathway component PulJ
MMKRAGFTIIEVTVFCALFLLMLEAVYGVFTYVSHFQHVHAAVVSAKQNALAGLGSMQEELAESRLNCVTWDTSQSGTPMLIFPSPRNAQGRFEYDTTNAPQLLWCQYVGYYVSNGVLMRASLPITPPAGSPPPPPSAATLLAAGVAQRPVSRDVASFAAGVVSGQPVQLDVTFSETAYDQPNAVSFETSISPIN